MENVKTLRESYELKLRCKKGKPVERNWRA